MCSCETGPKLLDEGFVKELNPIIEVISHEYSVEALFEFGGISANNFFEFFWKRRPFGVSATVYKRQQSKSIAARL